MNSDSPKPRDTKRDFPDWEELYRNDRVESMPWFHPELDPDLKQALTRLNIHSGRVLDLGSGPGTQAMALAELGFKVTATDVSSSAVEKALARAKAKGLEIDFRQDDILNSRLKQQFDFVFDRGCFHVLHPRQRPDYVDIIAGLIKPKGYLFLKCFSHLETRQEGPYRFAPKQITAIFSPRFRIHSIEKTLYQGTMEKFPQALFCVLQPALFMNNAGQASSLLSG